MSDYTTVSEFKNHAGIPLTDTALDGLLEQLVPQATSVIDGFIKRHLFATDYTEYYCGKGTNKLILKQRPINTITSIHVRSDIFFGQGDAVASGDLLTVGEDYAWEANTGIIYRIGDVWKDSSRPGDTLVLATEPGLGNIKVVYNAGYSESTLPKRVRYYANNLIVLMREAAKSGGVITSESLEYYSYSKNVGGQNGKGAPFYDIANGLGAFRETTW